MLRVGIIAEGLSDLMVLEELIRSSRPDAELIAPQPDESLTHLGQGWVGVRNWCRDFGPGLESFLGGVVPLPIHLIVIHVDCDIADHHGLELPCPPATDTAEAVSRLVRETWLNRASRPEFVVISTPSMSSEAWVAATLDPPHPNLSDIECDKDVANEFVRRRLLRRKDGQVKKAATAYRPLAQAMGRSLGLVFAHCSRAAAFRDEFEVAASRALPENGG